MASTSLELLLLLWMLFLSSSLAQFPSSPDQDPDIRTLTSPLNSNITVKYKSPPVGTCNTVYESQQQYTGYITLPPFTLAPAQQNYSINTFFWFIEARTDASTSPLTIYLNGGPGSSSLVGLFQEVGPCEVLEISESELGTRARDWGWDRSSNMLFIDQPNQVGFSYDQPTNGSLNLMSSTYLFPPSTAPSNQPAYAFLNGTFASNSVRTTENTTQIAAGAVWHILQTFLSAFPQYNGASTNDESQNGVVGINLFTESYGGKYGPAFAEFWEEQNQLIDNDVLPASDILKIQLVSLGVLQGCVDDLIQGPYYPNFAYENSYGLELISLLDQQNALSYFYSQAGCQQQIEACRNAVPTPDSDGFGDSSSADQICASAQQYCNDYVLGPYYSTGLSPYDISQSAYDPFPPDIYLEYLNTAVVQAAIGVPVNFTFTSGVVAQAFQLTGDYERGNQISDFGSLLEKGVRVALVYGDRDYICNWKGGEAVSFAIAAAGPSYYQSSFNAAGYAPIVTNQTYIGGVVRQAGNLSFSRIYDAGHLSPAYQPETLFTLFTRIIQGDDLSSGEPVDLSTFITTGFANATATNSAPPMASPTCYLRNVPGTCDPAQKSQLQSGEGVIINGVLYNSTADWALSFSSGGLYEGSDGDDSNGAIGVPGTPSVALSSPASSSVSEGGGGGGVLASGARAPPSSASTASSSSGDGDGAGATGVYTATSTPSMTDQRSLTTSTSDASSRLAREGDSVITKSLIVSWLVVCFSI